MRLVALPPDANAIWQVRDLLAAPVNGDFLGTDLAHNVLFGIVRDVQANMLPPGGPPPNPAIPIRGGRLLLLEDR